MSRIVMLLWPSDLIQLSPVWLVSLCVRAFGSMRFYHVRFARPPPQSRYRTFPLPGGSLESPLYTVPITLWWPCSPYSPFPDSWQALICSLSLTLCRFKMVILLDAYSMLPFEIGFFSPQLSPWRLNQVVVCIISSFVFIAQSCSMV